MTTPNWIRHAGRAMSQNSTSILSATTVAGVVATAILAAKAAPKATTALAETDETNESLGHAIQKRSPKETFLITWKFYLPAGVAGAATIACIIGANQIGLRRQAALLGAYTLADTAFREYKDEVLAQLGENKERKIHDEIVKRKIDENPPRDEQVIITGGGEQLCYDTLSGRYFKSDIETIRQAANTVNQEILGGNMYAPLNEFWGFLGLGSTTLGEEVGFNLEHFVELVFTSHLAQDGTPCLAVGYTKLPIAEYSKIV